MQRNLGNSILYISSELHNIKKEMCFWWTVNHFFHSLSLSRYQILLHIHSPRREFKIQPACSILVLWSTRSQVLNPHVRHGMFTHIPLARISHMAALTCKRDGKHSASFWKLCFGEGNTCFGSWITSRICYKLCFDRWGVEDILGRLGWPSSHLKGHFQKNKLIEDVLKWKDTVLLISASQSRSLWWKDSEERWKDDARELTRGKSRKES